MTDELLWYSGGIFLTNANDCTITDNNITGNERGMVLYHSSSNSLRRNNMTDNFYNFGVEFDIGPTSYLENDVDTSNTLNGKPIYWWINRHNEQVPADAGYVVVVNSTNIDVRNLVLEKNIHGILLVNVNNSIVFNNTVTGSKYGIFVRPAYMDTLCNNTVANNHVTAGGAGICLSTVNSTVCNNSLDGNLVGIYVPDNSNLVIGNNVTNHKFPPMEEWIWRRVPPHYMPFIYDSDEAVGVFLAGSNNTACYNTIQDNSYGLKTWNSGNSIHHNNFINNQKQLSVSSINEWDDGYPSGGNYWSDYNNRDSKWGQSQNQTGSDGIGDTPYYLAQWADPPSFTQEPSISDQYDYYPLMAPISPFYAGAWDEVSYYVDVVSNSTVSAFHFDPKKGALLRFSVTGESETNGFCRVTIPRDLLQVEDGCTVLVGLESTNYTLVSGESCAYLYFTYDHSTKTVYVIGTYVVPEFASTMMAHLFFVLITLAIVLSKKKSPKNTHSLESLKAYDAGFRIYDNTCRQMF
jgi:parallel beta-helix repeat protein